MDSNMNTAMQPYRPAEGAFVQYGAVAAEVTDGAWEEEARRIMMDTITADESIGETNIQHEKDMILYLYDGLVKYACSYPASQDGPVPTLDELMLEITYHNDDCVRTASHIRYTCSREGRAEIIEHLNNIHGAGGFTQADIDDAVESFVESDVESESLNNRYYYGSGSIPAMVMETLAQHNLPIYVDFDNEFIDEVYDQSKFKYRIIANDAQNVLIPDFQIKGFEEWINDNVSKHVIGRLMAFPDKTPPRKVLPEFAGHIVG